MGSGRVLLVLARLRVRAGGRSGRALSQKGEGRRAARNLPWLFWGEICRLSHGDAGPGFDRIVFGISSVTGPGLAWVCGSGRGRRAFERAWELSEKSPGSSCKNLA